MSDVIQKKGTLHFKQTVTLEDGTKQIQVITIGSTEAETEELISKSLSSFDSLTTYAKGAIVFAVSNDAVIAYLSLVDNNVGHALTETDYWKEISLGSVDEESVREIIEQTNTDAGVVSVEILDSLPESSDSIKAGVFYLTPTTGGGSSSSGSGGVSGLTVDADSELDASTLETGELLLHKATDIL